MSFATIARWLPLALAAGLIALMLIPASVWRHPVNDAVYRGFDANLLYTSGTGVDVSPSVLTIRAESGSGPFAHLVTTPLSYSADFEAEIESESAKSIPLRVEIWSPATAAGYVIFFDASNQEIREQTITHAIQAPDLAGGNVGLNRTLGSYSTGQRYHVTVQVDQAAHVVRTRIAGGALDVSTAVGRADAPDLFAGFRPALTVSASGGGGSTEASISNFSLTLPSQSANTAEPTVKVSDALATGLTLAGWAAALALSIAGLARLAFKWRPAVPALAPSLLVAGVGTIVYIAANALLFGVASPHFDVFAAKVWSYVAFKDGFSDLYYRSLLVPAAVPTLGVPFHEATFPYGITKAYFYLVAGGLYSLIPGTGPIGGSFSFEALLKGLNVIFGVADAALVYAIARPLLARRPAIWSALFVALNPALIFVMSVWGSTESVSLFFVLASILFAARNRPLPAWVMLAAAAYTRPQMLVVAFLLAAVYLKGFGLARNIGAIAWTVIVAFVFIGPIALAISPSVPVDYVARTFAYHIGNGQADVAYLGMSPGNFSVWTIPFELVSGAQGVERMWAPSTLSLAGDVSYGAAGAVLSIGLVLTTAAAILIRRAEASSVLAQLPLVCIGMLAWLLVTPGVISRYLVYAVVLLILCRRWLGTSTYFGGIAVLTLTALAGIYLQLSLDFVSYSGGQNVLSPYNNSISRFVFDVVSSDRFINLASLANLAVLIVLVVGVFGRHRSTSATALTPASTGA